MYRICRKIKFLSGRFPNFCKKWYVLEETLGLISGSLPENPRGFIYMLTVNILDLQIKQHAQRLYFGS